MSAKFIGTFTSLVVRGVQIGLASFVVQYLTGHLVKVPMW